MEKSLYTRIKLYEGIRASDICGYNTNEGINWFQCDLIKREIFKRVTPVS